MLSLLFTAGLVFVIMVVIITEVILLVLMSMVVTGFLFILCGAVVATVLCPGFLANACGNLRQNIESILKIRVARTVYFPSVSSWKFQRDNVILTLF